MIILLACTRALVQRCEDLEQQLEQSAQDRDAAQERARELSVENGRLKDSVARLEASLVCPPRRLCPLFA